MSIEDTFRQIVREEVTAALAALGSGAPSASPGYAPPQGAQVAAAPPVETQTAPATTVAPPAAAPVQTAPGPQAVPTLQDLVDKLTTLGETKGHDVSVSLVKKYGGTNPETGVIQVSAVPAANYVPLMTEVNQHLGVQQ